MANLNLSEFTEKLFVADADHTFIWDTANAISKRVSRNSWLNSGTLTSDAPVTISQTWSTTGTYTAAKVNVTETATANPLSKLLDLQVGTVSKFAVFKDGSVQTSLISTNGAGALNLQYGATGKINCFTDLDVLATNRIAFSDTFLQRDGAPNTLALRNGAAAQTFNVYGTWTTAITNFERLAIKYNTTDVAYQIAAEKGTTNGDYRPLQLWTGGASRLHVTTAGNVGIGTTAPRTKLHLEDLATNPAIELSGTTIPNYSGFGILPSLGSNTTFRLAQGSLANGGAQLNGFTANTNAVSAVSIIGNLGSTSPTQPAVAFYSYKHDGGTNRTALASTEISSQWSNGSTPLMTLLGGGNVGIGTTSPSSKLHVAGNSSPSITVDNTVNTGASQLLFKNTVVTGDTDGIFLNGSTQTGFGGAGSLNIKATTGPIAFHTASVTNALSIAQSGVATFITSASIGGGSYLFHGSQAAIGSSGNGRHILFDSGGSFYDRLQIGGTSASFPAIKRVGTELQIVIASTTAAAGVAAADADLTFIEDRYRRKGNGTPEGVVTAPIGAVYHNTTGGAGTSFYVKESGTGNTGWVGK